YDAATRMASLQPNAPLAYSTTYTARLTGGTSGIKARAGNSLAADYVWSFATEATATANCPCTIWSPTATPVQAASNDANSVELGLKFRSIQDGFITGVRFYKSAQ